MASNRTARTPAEGDSTIQRPALKHSFYVSRSNPADALLEPSSSALLGLPESRHSTLPTADTTSYNAPPWTQPSPSSTSDSSARSAGSMIPPTSSFYDPDQAVPHEGQNYQQWIDAFHQGQMQYGGNVPNQVTAPSYQQGPSHSGELHPPVHPGPQMQSQYPYVPNSHYAPSPSHGFDQDPYLARSERRGTITGPNVVSRTQNVQGAPSAGDASANTLYGAISYQPEYQTPNRSPNSPAFYFQMNEYSRLPENQQASFTPSTQHTPDPMSASTNYTPSSSYAELHQSSVSPPGSTWVDDSVQSVPSSRSGKSVPSTSTSTSSQSFARSQQVPQINTNTGAPPRVPGGESTRAGPMTGKRARGSAPSAPVRGRKRTRKEGGEPVDDSDSSSDEEIGAQSGRGATGRPTRL
ncbi:hypothetical protein NEOLEDRAFT_1174530 [Neolentinus lepideus HHB14362 ss-1]|uniref:Uncharacterized protein n=1 Tax=Neolentinus lepideus HHB14362 ss-1 TaxID=1314782 RepID=A0A165VUM0_9AGAM|nr:hypothetical protein NEOLEDRAFT_1174530 [Neolentinus lepideus HHB14362 ss-1]